MSSTAPDTSAAPAATLAGVAPAVSVRAAVTQAEAPAARWNLGTRLAFRWCVVYFSLYVVYTQMIGSLLQLPLVGIPNLSALPPMRNFAEWSAAHVFRISGPLGINLTGSGDRTFDWMLVFCFAAIATVATIVWSIVDRARDRYVGVHKWFRLFLRFALASTMLQYGAVKVFPLQMSAPNWTRLLERFGDFSPMGVLWASIGASTAYEMFSGLAEVTAAILLFIPGITTLGSLVGLAVVTHVFVLNMTYDVPVKLFSFHLLLMCLVLLAPEGTRLLNVLILNRTTGPSTEPPLFRSRRAMRVAIVAQFVFAAYLLGLNFYGARQAWTSRGGGGPKSALYGIWNVDTMKIDGHTRSPLVTDYDRWRRVIFQAQTTMAFQRMDETFARYGANIDTVAKTLTLSKPTDKNWSARLTFQRPAADRLILEGAMDNHAVHMELRLADPNSFLLLTRGFHWIQEVPFNR